MIQTSNKPVEPYSSLPSAGASRASTGPTAPDDLDRETMLPPEVARMLKVSISYLAKARMRGDGPPYHKVGRSVRYVRTEVRQWLTSRGRNSTSED